MSTESRSLVIAIDGPAASGKTSLGRALAKRYRLRFVETGKMYRAVALAFDRSISLEKIDIEVTEAAQPFPPGWLIAVGGRLLVYLPRALRLSEDERLAAFAAGRGCRDAAGYRRFRLVETLDGSTADSP
ncbi:MAG: (d)CMP kinase, partial [Desulfuromonadales bacterium]